MSVSVVTPVVVLSTGSVQQADLPSSFDENAKESKVLKIVQSNAHSNEESVMEVMDKYGWEENFMMNVGDVKGKIVDDVVGETLAKKVAGIDRLVFVELGCYCGYSAVRIGRLLRRWFESVANVNNATRPHFYSLEINPIYAAVAQKITTHAGLGEYVTIILGAGADSIISLRDILGISKFDFVFIDHWKDMYLADFKILENAGVLHKGTVVCADNILYPGAPDYLKYVEDSPKLTTVLHRSRVEYHDDKEDAVAVSICL